MLTVLRTASLRAAPMIARAPIAQATVARYAASHRWKSAYAVDAPDGTHDDQDLEESADWAKRVVDVASATEDTAAINKMHDAVFEKTMFAVDAPDGQHDLEDVVSNSILCRYIMIGC